MLKLNFTCVCVCAGEWWKKDIEELYTEFLNSGGDPDVSDAYTINGQPGDLYPCSKPGRFLNCYLYIRTTS